MVPVSARTAVGEQFLREQRSHDLDIDRRHQVTKQVFEDTAAWVPALEDCISNLGRRLLPAPGARLLGGAPFGYSSSSSGSMGFGMQAETAEFPIDKILEELEEIAAALAAAAVPLGPGWAARICVGLDISLAIMSQTYLSLIERCVGRRPE